MTTDSPDILEVLLRTGEAHARKVLIELSANPV
jgi:hypothetical protein